VARRTITDMTFLLILSLVATAAVAATVRAILHDGPVGPPRSHLVDPDFVAPADRTTSGSFGRPG
jgi:hypothetical protein